MVGTTWIVAKRPQSSLASDCKPFPNLPSFDPCPPAKGQEEGHLPPELATPSPSSTWTHPRPARSSRLCKGYPQMAENSWLSSHRQLSLHVLNSHRGIHPLCVHAYVETCRMHVQKEGCVPQQFTHALHAPTLVCPWTTSATRPRRAASCPERQLTTSNKPSRQSLINACTHELEQCTRA